MSAMKRSGQSHVDAPEERPPVDLMQGAVVDVRGHSVPPVLLVVCDQMFGAGHLNENEHDLYTSIREERTTPVL